MWLTIDRQHALSAPLHDAAARFLVIGSGGGRCCGSRPCTFFASAAVVAIFCCQFFLLTLYEVSRFSEESLGS